MTAVSADSFYFFALLNAGDAAHDDAVQFTLASPRPIVTTAFVLLELGDGLARVSRRAAFAAMLDRLRSTSYVMIVPPSERLLEVALDLYRSRPDKGWSLTDCTSFVVMRDRGLTDVLTRDHHFRQAGFTPLL